MVLLGVKDEEDLLGWADKCWFKDIKHTIFHEPDINAHTALAITPSADSSWFKELKLL
jgi:hypothetical protein